MHHSTDWLQARRLCQSVCRKANAEKLPEQREYETWSRLLCVMPGPQLSIVHPFPIHIKSCGRNVEQRRVATVTVDNHLLTVLICRVCFRDW